MGVERGRIAEEKSDRNLIEMKDIFICFIKEYKTHILPS